MNFAGASLLAILQSVQSKSIASKLAPTGGCGVAGASLAA